MSSLSDMGSGLSKKMKAQMTRLYMDGSVPYVAKELYGVQMMILTLKNSVITVEQRWIPTIPMR